MRINLVTPFAEKDAAKALGARWDAARKLWYINDVADLTPFLRWIPDLEAAKGRAAGLMTRAAKVSVKPSKGTVAKSAVEVLHCGCNVPPWEECMHTAKSLQP